MSSLRKAFDAAGVSAKVIVPGDVWTVPNELLFLIRDRRRQRSSEVKPRTVVVVQDAEHCKDPTYPTALIVPTSHRVDLKNDLALELPAGAGGLEVASIAMPDIMQPVLKRDLLRRLGALPPDKLDELLVRIALAVGMVEVEAEP